MALTPDSAAERDAALVSRAGINPLRDAIVVALVVFGSIAGSAVWIHFQAWKSELTHHRKAVDGELPAVTPDAGKGSAALFAST